MDNANQILQLLNGLAVSSSYVKWSLGLIGLFLIIQTIVLGAIINYWLPIAKFQRELMKDAEDKYRESKSINEELKLLLQKNQDEIEEANKRMINEINRVKELATIRENDLAEIANQYKTEIEHRKRSQKVFENLLMKISEDNENLIKLNIKMSEEKNAGKE